MEQKRILRVVVASPSNVQSERDALAGVIEELNRGIAGDKGLLLEFSRWETDAYPGFHAEGSQALIDSVLQIENCDVLIGVFWKRFGTPVHDAKSGTEHEFRCAYEAWKEKGYPQIIVYFKQQAYTPKSKQETDQWGEVLEFKKSFPKEGLWWTYRGKSQFEKLVRNHLTQFIIHNLKKKLNSKPHGLDIYTLVHEVREKVKLSIQDRCGTMRVLDMNQPVGLNDIYTNVNLLEKITGRRRKQIAAFQQECNSHDFERFGLGRITERRVPGLEAIQKYPKLIILGKPGAGKTTFLKYIAIQCNSGKFQAECVPIFVTLKDFAEAAKKPGLLKYISHQFSRCGVTANKVTDLFNQGRALVLLDGLDEVREEDNNHVIKEIYNFSEQFRYNHFVMTCRIAAREYTFEKFTEVEVADFDDEQIITFVTNWFKGKAVKAESFLERLEDNERISEIATSPLLLTLLCLTFEESGDFTANRSELYKEGLDALLKKWDAKRGIYRAQVYKKLSVQRKEELLGKIALTTFERSDYFFKQKGAEQYITDYIRNLPDAKTDPEELQLDSERVLKSIESQHGLLVERAKGIYSFSHLTFHEYFTAREIVFGTQPLEKALLNLITHITEKRWREVFFLAVGMSPSADYLLQLMKQQADTFLARNKKLQQFLIWVHEKSLSIQVLYNPAAIRAFYLTLAIDHDPALTRFLAHSLDVDHGHILDLNLNRAGARAHLLDLASVRADILKLDLTDAFNLDRARALARGLQYNLALDCIFELDLEEALQKLKHQLPQPDSNDEIFKKWWQVNGQAWYEQLRAALTQYCKISQNWQFSNYQKELLKQYYDANLLLVECLNSDCYMSRKVRSQIEDTLLLPIAEIKQQQD